MRRFAIGIALTGAYLASLATPAMAASYRILFQGSEVRAVQSGAQPQAAGYLGLSASPDPANLSVPPASSTGSRYHGAGVPNQIVTFLHPYTEKAITVPLTLPVGKPRIEIRSDRVVYNYGLFGYRVIVRFLRDGGVEVTYRDRVP